MFRFTCHPDGGPSFEVVARSRAITAWETAPGQPKGEPQRTLSDVTKNMKMTYMVDLAWYAAERAGQTDLDIITWRKQVDVDLERYEDDEGEELGSGPTTPVTP